MMRPENVRLVLDDEWTASMRRVEEAATELSDQFGGSHRSRYALGGLLGWLWAPVLAVGLVVLGFGHARLKAYDAAHVLDFGGDD